MERFDVAFANIYLEAFRGYLEDSTISESWRVSFEAGSKKITIMQHLLMGMNAHINYDLGIAASRIMIGKPIQEPEHDFGKVNAILAGLVDEMQERIGSVSSLSRTSRNQKGKLRNIAKWNFLQKDTPKK